jgi:hypothetical protein
MRRPAFLVVVLLALTMPTVAFAQGTDETTSHNINARLVGSFTFVQFGPDYYDVYALGVTRGTVQGLGLTHLFTFQQAQESGSPAFTRFFLVAANGDKITGTYEGGTTVITGPASLVGTATWVITGGTGRFENATGTLNAAVFLTVPNGDWMSFEWPAVWTLNGTIKY